MELVHHERADATVARSCRLSFEDVQVDLSFDGNVVTAFAVDGVEVPGAEGDFRVRQGGGRYEVGVFPSLTVPKVKDGTFAARDREIGLERHLLGLLDRVFHGRTGRGTRRGVIGRLGVGRRDAMRLNLRSAQSSDYWSRQVDALPKSRLEEIRRATVALAVPHLFSLLNAESFGAFAGVAYANPLRAAAERYYRRQNLAVEEVDPQGTNLAVFLRSLTNRERDQFAEWTREHLGFATTTRSEGGHVSIEVEESGARFNLADMGFGFSQVLPVVTQVWSQIYRPRRYRSLYGDVAPSVLLAIEQPELHLHPALQARFGDLLVAVVAAARDAGVHLILVVETHSEALVGRVGNQVSVGVEVGPDDVGVLLFERGVDGTAVKQTAFDSRGLLIDWPVGFFDPDPVLLTTAE